MIIEKLTEEQKRLAKKVLLTDDFSVMPPSTIAGCQIFHTAVEQITVVVLLDYNTRQVIDKKYVVCTPKIPYISFFQGYRDIPAVVEAITQLSQKPDLVMYPGEGILHPRRFGPASHLGLATDIPTIGVSKKLCVGETKEEDIFYEGEKKGMVVNTRSHAKPLYVSPGHKISLESCRRIVVSMSKEGSKLPDPLRIAHNYGIFVLKNLSQKSAGLATKPAESSTTLQA